MIMEESPLVSIQCLVYNHEPYLSQCLDGFVMQQTNFRFEAIVHDDASTDGSATIIREYAAKYPDIIKPIYEIDNQYCKGGFERIFTIMNDASHGKYIAFCEGDDYWTDPFKLQKQIDILEEREEFGCVYTAYNTVDIHGIPINYLPSIQNIRRSFTGDVFYELLVANFPQTLTVCYRKELLEYPFSPPYTLDYSLFLSLAIQKKFYYLSEPTGVYRINPNGMVQSGGLGEIGDLTEISLYFLCEYFRSKEFRRKGLEGNRIKRILFTRWSFVWTKRKFYKYLKIILCDEPLYILLIPLLPLLILERVLYKMFFHN